MSISASQLVFRKPEEVSEAASNGGAMTFESIINGVKNNLWNDIFEAERQAGSNKHVKCFLHVNNNDPNGNNVGLDFVAPRLFVESRTPGDDMVIIFLGTQSDTDATKPGSPDYYGMGLLDSPVSGGANTITVRVEDWSQGAIFRDGDKIRISDKTSIIDSGGNEEYHIIDTGGVSPSGNDITLTLVGTLANGYAADSKVASVIEPGDVQCVVDNFVNGGSGTITAAAIATDQTGTTEDSWTITFTGASTYNVSGVAAGADIASGNIGSDLAVTNPDTGSPYFRILASQITGPFANLETVTFTTSPSAIPIWMRRIVPPAAGTLTGNSVILACDGESA